MSSSPSSMTNTSRRPSDRFTEGIPYRLANVLIPADKIQRRTVDLAKEIDAAYSDNLTEPLVVICILKGSFFFTADLTQQMTVPLEIDFMAVRSYGARTESSGTVQLVKDISTNLHGRDVLLVEDIIDSGLTTAFLFRHLHEHQPKSVRIVSLLYKETGKKEEVQCDWTGFTIGDKFVVGYGLDYDERWRNTSDIYEMDTSDAPPL